MHHSAPKTNGSFSRKEPLVSVIVPIYNVEAFLDQCLSSIRQQTHANLQIICLNDGSTDNSFQIIEKHAVEDSRIRVVNKQNEGYGASCNKGLDLAEGTWISVIEPDDWIEPTMYEDMLVFEDSLQDNCDIIKTPYWRIVTPDTPQQTRLNCSYRKRIKPSHQPFGIAEAPHLLRHHPSIWSALYRTSFLNEHTIRFHEIPGSGWADNPFLADTLLRARRIAYLDRPYYCYREETPEQARASIRRDPLLPIKRWNDVLDIAESLEITNPIIIEEIYRRGFTNLGGVIQYVGETDQVTKAACQMFSRMNPQYVFDSLIISPSNKQLFARLLGIECPTQNSSYWIKSLLGEFIYTLKNAGPRYTAQMVIRSIK